MEEANPSKVWVRADTSIGKGKEKLWIQMGTQSAESRIRDTDMAAEMVKHSKHSILQQAGQAMLSQANQLPKVVLRLLQ